MNIKQPVNWQKAIAFMDNQKIDRQKAIAFMDNQKKALYTAVRDFKPRDTAYAGQWKIDTQVLNSVGFPNLQ